VAIDVENEKLIRIADLSRLVPGRTGQGVSVSTVHRWMLKGRRNRDGEIIRLDSLVVGGSRYTTREALRRFTAALNPDGLVCARHPEVERLLDVAGY